MVSTLKEPPPVHVTVGTTVPSTTSVAVRVDDPVPPEPTSNVAGLKVTTGGVVSLGMTETVSVAVPAFPEASEAVAVHVAMVLASTSGAV